jgi:aminoglycoside phosphotransferase family enzyme/predicted kinase
MNEPVRLPNLVDDLQRPEAYPPPRPTAVTVIATHISWVFVTDHDVWKLKRPVNYGFVDYTTLERRRHFCEEEVRLNWRLAPDVYLAVVPVGIERGRYTFVTAGPAVDYAVRMRRLPSEASAEALLGRGALTLEHLERLAARLARFYAGQPPITVGDHTSVIATNVAENFDQTRSFVGRFVAASSFQSVRTWQRQWLRRGADRLRLRQRSGRVRDGHGDLRLEHIYFESETAPPVIIDAVEFSERFRIADVAADAGFVAMDLEAHGRRDLGEGFLAVLARETDDYDLYGVIDFYLSYRAWVRGKVAALVATDPSTPPVKAARKAGEARVLFQLAEAYTRERTDAAPVIAVGGLVGAGKSTLAAALGRSLAMPVLASDRTRKSLAGVAPTTRAPDAAYTEAFSRRTFRELLRRAEAVVDSGRGVVLDATFGSRELRHRARDLARRHGCPFRFVEVRCDDATLRERLRRRSLGPSVSDATETLLPWMRERFEPVTELDVVEHVVVDGGAPIDVEVEHVQRALSAKESL